VPISVDAQLTKLTQAEFAEVAYGVMAEIFSLHGELGRLFDEKVYKNALADRICGLQTEVEIKVTYKDFCKSYYIDALASSGAPFELKAVDALHRQHRTQLVNYLLLTGLQHGKLVNLHPEKVEHEFVNASQTHSERQHFNVRDSLWQPADGFGLSQKSLVVDILSDWGTGLERSLYQEALIHFFGGKDKVCSETHVVLNGKPISTQPVLLCDPTTAFRVTTFENNANNYRKDLLNFINSTALTAIQWINIARNRITFETLH